MKISHENTATMIINTQNNNSPVTIGDSTIKEANSLKYLGSIVRSEGHPSDTNNVNLIKAKHTTIKISPVWRANGMSRNTETKLVESIILPILTHGLETIVLSKRIG